MSKPVVLPTVVLFVALALAGCTSSQTSGSSSDSSTTEVGSAPRPATDTTAGGKSNFVAPTDREIVTSGSVTLKTSNPIKAADSAAALVEAAGGRIDARTQTAPTKTESGRATLDLRIPSAALTSTLAQLKKLGTVESIKISANDVTTQGQDLDAQIHALSTSVTRLLVLEAKASDTKTLIELESAISDRQGQLDSLTSQRRLLTDQVSMSTISLALFSPADVPAVTPANPADAFSAGLAGFAQFFVSLFIVLSFLLPWLVLAAIVVTILVIILRRRAHRTAGVVTS